jgi:hypothetical protein
MIFMTPLHWGFGPLDELANFRHGGIERAHGGSLCLSRGSSKESVEGSLLRVLEWV